MSETETPQDIQSDTKFDICPFSKELFTHFKESSELIGDLITSRQIHKTEIEDNNKIYLICGVCGSKDISYEQITLTSGTELELHVVCEDCRTTARLSPPID